MVSDSWENAKRTLNRVFKLSNPRIVWLSVVRDELRKLTSGGMSTAPDFTLHSEIHSDNVVILLGQLIQHLNRKLSEYEAYVLAASAYMHDIGMFIGAGRFNREVLPNLSTLLKVCEHDLCDGGNQYAKSISGKPVDYQIRTVHHLVSAYLIHLDGDKMFRLPGDDQRHVIIISRGHRKANLREEGCSCYQTVQSQYGEVRRDLLASLLRLADGLDFYPNRAPEEILLTRAYDFLQSPIALRHWLNHFFATSVYVTVGDQGGNRYLDCQYTYVVPSQRTLNQQTYKDFFEPLFHDFWQDAQQGDFHSQKYSPTFMESMGIKSIRANFDVRSEMGGRRLPDKIAEEIERSGAKNAIDFILHLESDSGHTQSLLSPLPVMNRRPEVQAFKLMLDGDDPQHNLLLMAGEHGQGKTLLMKTFENMARESKLTCLRIDLNGKVEIADILDGIWQRLGANQFPFYSRQREKSDQFEAVSREKRQQELIQSFFDDWREIDKKSRIVLLFDTYEKANPGLQDWIEKMFLNGIKNIIPVIVVIGGRKWLAVSDYWQLHCHRFPLEGVQIHDYRDYATKRGVNIPEPDLEKLHKVMKGIPKLFVEYIDTRLQQIRA